jgi:hypothetical protein
MGEHLSVAISERRGRTLRKLATRPMTETSTGPTVIMVRESWNLTDLYILGGSKTGTI